MTILIQFSTHPLVHALGWSLLHFCWQGTAVGVILASILAALRGRSPQLRYAACCAALVLMVVLPVVTLARLAEAPHTLEAPAAISTADQAPILTGLSPTAEPWFDQLITRLDHSVPWIILAWLAGIMVLLGRLNLGLVATHRMKSFGNEPAPVELQATLRRLCVRLGVLRAVRLANSAVVQVPTVIGWLRPVILMPIGCLVGLSASQVEAVLAHEVAHIRRNDYLINIFQSVVETLLFYHPAVWWVSQQVRREREHCCDDLAVRINGDSLAYARALSFLEERRASMPVLALGANGGVLAMRIRRLLGRPQAPVVSRMAAITLLATAFLAVGLCVGAAARAASEQPGTENASTLPVKYQQWLNEDVIWIISPEERKAFSQLKGDEERNKFMEQFWERRNPTPNSADNPAKREHYRRIKYADAHFAAAKAPGWKTDRGRIYIVYGPPDEIESHPAGSPAGSTKPTEFWRYHSVQERVEYRTKKGSAANMVDKENVDMKFVDTCSCGDYQLEKPEKN